MVRCLLRHTTNNIDCVAVVCTGNSKLLPQHGDILHTPTPYHSPRNHRYVCLIKTGSHPWIIPSPIESITDRFLASVVRYLLPHCIHYTALFRRLLTNGTEFRWDEHHVRPLYFSTVYPNSPELFPLQLHSLQLFYNNATDPWNCCQWSRFISCGYVDRLLCNYDNSLYPPPPPVQGEMRRVRSLVNKEVITRGKPWCVKICTLTRLLSSCFVAWWLHRVPRSFLCVAKGAFRTDIDIFST